MEFVTRNVKKIMNLLVLGNFSVSQNVYKNYTQDELLCGNGKKSKLDLTLSQTTIFRLFQTERACRRQFQI